MEADPQLDIRRRLRRRCLLAAMGVVCYSRNAVARAVQTAADRLRFPHDHGAHPFKLTEWWYITGSLHDEAGRALGMQITFFRNRPRIQEDNPSAFAPKQLLFAHVAVSDPAVGR